MSEISALKAERFSSVVLFVGNPFLVTFSVLTVMSSWLLSDFTFTCVLVDFLFEPIVSGRLWCTVCRYAGGFPVFVLFSFDFSFFLFSLHR